MHVRASYKQLSGWNFATLYASIIRCKIWQKRHISLIIKMIDSCAPSRQLVSEMVSLKLYTNEGYHIHAWLFLFLIRGQTLVNRTNRTQMNFRCECASIRLLCNATHFYLCVPFVLAGPQLNESIDRLEINRETLKRGRNNVHVN